MNLKCGVKGFMFVLVKAFPILGFWIRFLSCEGSETEDPDEKGRKERRKGGRKEGRKAGRQEGRHERGRGGKPGNELIIAWGDLRYRKRGKRPG